MNLLQFNMRLFLLVHFFLLLFVSKSYAYIDPGSSSIILQVIAGFIAGLAATFNLWVQKVKSVFVKISDFLKKKSK